MVLGDVQAEERLAQTDVSRRANEGVCTIRHRRCAGDTTVCGSDLAGACRC
jgi:hypothetical protein